MKNMKKTSPLCILGLLVLSVLVPAAAAQPLTPGPEIPVSYTHLTLPTIYSV